MGFPLGRKFFGIWEIGDDQRKERTDLSSLLKFKLLKNSALEVRGKERGWGLRERRESWEGLIPAKEAAK